MDFGRFFLEHAYDVESKVRLDDGRWHYVEYDKNNKLFTLRVDTTSQEYEITGAWQNVDYSKNSFLGEISTVAYTGEVKIQDFIRISKEKDKVNFVTGLYDSYRTHNAGFRVEPEYVLPKFSERLPYTTPKPLPSTRATLVPSLAGEGTQCYLWYTEVEKKFWSLGLGLKNFKNIQRD